jgi:uncharacterized phiE125 gp8 family phage protein
MSSILLTPPSIEPLSLDEAKAYLRVANDDEDDLITALIAAARAHVEAATRRALVTQTWRLARDAWPSGGRIAVLPAPLRDLAAARVYDLDGTAQALDLQAFVVDTIAAPGVVSFAPWALPAPGRTHAGIELDVVVGYGDGAGDVPKPLVLAMRILLAHWYENRGIVAAEGGAPPLPVSIAGLLAPYRVLSL